MNRIITALALSGLFVAAPAFAKTHSTKPVASAGDKAAAGDKADSDTAAKPAKKVKKSKKTTTTTEKSGEGSSEKPAEAPAK